MTHTSHNCLKYSRNIPVRQNLSKSLCQGGSQRGSKRRRVSSSYEQEDTQDVLVMDECHVSESLVEGVTAMATQTTIEASFSANVNKRKLFTQAEFDEWVVSYVIDSVLPIRHVDTEPFIELMKNVAPGTSQHLFVYN